MLSFITAVVLYSQSEDHLLWVLSTRVVRSGEVRLDRRLSDLMRSFACTTNEKSEKMETQTHTTIATFAASIMAHCGAFIVQGSPVFAVLILLRQK